MDSAFCLMYIYKPFYKSINLVSSVFVTEFKQAFTQTFFKSVVPSSRHPQPKTTTMGPDIYCFTLRSYKTVMNGSLTKLSS